MAKPTLRDVNENPNLARHISLSRKFSHNGTAEIDCAFYDEEARTPTACRFCGADAWLNPTSNARRCGTCREIQ